MGYGRFLFSLCRLMNLPVIRFHCLPTPHMPTLRYARCLLHASHIPHGYTLLPAIRVPVYAYDQRSPAFSLTCALPAHSTRAAAAILPSHPQPRAALCFCQHCAAPLREDARRTALPVRTGAHAARARTPPASAPSTCLSDRCMVDSSHCDIAIFHSSSILMSSGSLFISWWIQFIGSY